MPTTWTIAAALVLGLAARARSGAEPAAVEPGAPGSPAPSFATAVRVLDLDRSVAFAGRTRRMLEVLIADDQHLEKAFEPLVKGDEGRLYVRGDASADLPRLDWLDELGDPPPKALADFVLRAEARNESELRSSKLSFRSIVGLTPAEMLALTHRMLGQLEGSDAAILAAYRRDLPRLATWTARIVDLSRVRVLEPGGEPDYTTLAIEAPLDEDALDESYPTLGKLLSWAREIHWRVTDDRGRVLAVLSFDGDERIFRAREWKRGGDLLWSDGTKPLRDAGGGLVPVSFELTRDATFHLEVAARAVLFKLGAVRLGSFELPSSDLELRYLGDQLGEKADWQLRIRSISDAPALVEWMLPLAQLRESLIRTFQLSLISAPSAETRSLHDMGLVMAANLPRSASLDFAQAMARWASDSFSLADLMRASRDFAAAAEQDLSALRTPAIARVDPPAP